MATAVNKPPVAVTVVIVVLVISAVIWAVLALMGRSKDRRGS